MIRSLTSAIALAAAVVSSTAAVPAMAAVRVFSGIQMNDTPPPQPSALCTPAQVRVSFSPTTAISTGSSNFGSFGSSQAHCIGLPPSSYSGGIFDYSFAAGDMFFGTYSGNLTPTGVPAVLNSVVDFVVTGGTGRFLGATGFVTGIGVLDRRPTRPVSTLSVNGVLNLPAVPEPATWAMMIGGFGAVGAMARRRRAMVAA